ncbi:MAG: class I SAM-dependent DNA methyltransferase [Bacteroidetes bacterium]|nr:MAG: class I SAM-dependent DNA methyltransferase [Bacteroidota bacterium]TAG85527.1 MAG: class I SAM-dependent DNA methyltransferase [Bacteroidota bacterium]
MKLETIKYDKAINPSYFKQSLKEDNIILFKINFRRLFERIKETESEEHNKNIISDFLKNTFYKNEYEINTAGRKDLVIHKGNTSRSPVAIIIEAKSPTNKNEMIGFNNPNVKAFHETIHYFLHERIIKQNKEIKHIIITNIYDWFVFDATDFEKYFYANKNFRNNYTDWNEKKLLGNTTDWFYNEIAKPFVEKEIEKMDCVYFNLLEYEQIVKNESLEDDSKLINLYKLLSPEHLLKLPFANDYNKIDTSFYNELLYILGLEETKDGSKKIIKRTKEKNRKNGSLIENVINFFETKKQRVDLGISKNQEYNKPEEYFEIALELCITWLNRILFLKLLEAQLVKYHRNDANYQFLNYQKINDYSEVDELFFEVMAVPFEKRNTTVTEKFGNIPYLNSSLFDPTDFEQKYIFISCLKKRLSLPIFPHSVLNQSEKFKNTANLNTLEYIFEFLNAYNFSSDQKAEIQKDNKTIINAAVLGLIFEKINGYKDGSFYTPSFITTFVSREILISTIIQKFSKKLNKNIRNFEHLKDLIEYVDDEQRQKANDIINSIKICDPAVGSGHFLVSALNEIIAIKSDLKILQYVNGKRIKTIKITNNNDELELIDKETSEPFQYYVNEKHQPIDEKQEIQHALFTEKRTLIEKCLFGVDINPKSVLICRLRLWIELLKNSYYTSHSNYKYLETLPNIDINIVTGNSLISKFDKGLDIFEKQAVKDLIYIYKTNATVYKNENDYDHKIQTRMIIENVKQELLKFAKPQDKHYRSFLTKSRELENLLEIKPQSEPVKKLIVKLSTEIAEHQKRYQENYYNVYENSLEWALEFPEILNENGDFIGFDIVIGNPPYFPISNESKLKEVNENYTIYKPTADIYTLFIERGLQILKPEGKLCMITSNKWLRTAYGDSLRNYLITKAKIDLLLDFGTIRVFDEATVDTNIIFVTKQKPENKNIKAVGFQKYFAPEIDDLTNYIAENTIELTNLTSKSWNIVKENEDNLKSKIEKIGKPLITFGVNINRGIATGYNKAFIIDTQKKDQLLNADPKNAEVIKPLLRGVDIKKYFSIIKDLWIIYIPWHFPLHDDEIKGYSLQAEEQFKLQYPTLFEYFLANKENLLKRNTAETNIRYEWYALQRCAATYIGDFKKEKIMWQAITKKFDFHYDTQGMYSDVTTFIMTGENLKYILGILNSFFFTYCMDNIYLLGDTFRSKNIILQNFPIPEITEENKTGVKKIEILIDEILAKKHADINSDISEETKEVDKLVYKLYNLDDMDIEMIDKQQNINP